MGGWFNALLGESAVVKEAPPGVIPVPDGGSIAFRAPDGSGVEFVDEGSGAWTINILNPGNHNVRFSIANVSGNVTISADNSIEFASGISMGFFGATPVVQPTVTGVKADPVAASIVAALAALGLVIDGTT